jgi:hypothetical protein
MALMIAAVSNYPLAFDGSNYLLQLLNNQELFNPVYRYSNAIFQLPTLLASRFIDSLPVLRAIFSFSYSTAVPISLLITYSVLPKEKKSYWNFILFCLIGGTILEQGFWVTENLFATQLSWPFLILLLSDRLTRIQWIIFVILLIFLFIAHPATIVTMAFFMIFMAYKYYETPDALGSGSVVKIIFVSTFIGLKLFDYLFLKMTYAVYPGSFIRYLFPNPNDPVRICALYTPHLVAVSAQYFKKSFAYIVLSVLFFASTIYLSLSNLATPVNVHGDVVLSSILLMAVFAFLYSKNIAVSTKFTHLSRAVALLFLIVISSLSLLWHNYVRSIHEFFYNSSVACIEFSKYREDYKPNGFAGDWTGSVSLVSNDSRKLKKAILPEPIDCQNFDRGTDFIYHRDSVWTAQLTKRWFR